MDTARFAPPDRDERPYGPPRVRFAARLLASKGVGDVVDAARRVRAARPEAEFLIAGTPDAGNPDAVVMVSGSG